MKKAILTTALSIIILGGMSIQAKGVLFNQELTNDSLVTQSFAVSGNCGMCKATIEKAALSIDGVTMANWDASKKRITVTYNLKVTNLDAIHKAIALSGYDTDKMKADKATYNKLPGCCQYNRKLPEPKKN